MSVIADRDRWIPPEHVIVCNEVIHLPPAVYEHLLRIPLGLNAFEWSTRWRKAWTADWHSKEVQALKWSEREIERACYKHYAEASLMRPPQLPAHEEGRWNAPEFVAMLGFVLGVDAVRIPAASLELLRTITLGWGREEWGKLVGSYLKTDARWPADLPLRERWVLIEALWDDYEKASTAYTQKTQTPQPRELERWVPPVFVEVLGGRYVPPTAVVELLRTAAVGITEAQWHKLWDMAWAAGTSDKMWSRSFNVMPTPRELGYISKGYWKSYQAHYERVTKPYGIFTKADYDYGFNTGVIGKTVSEMTHKEAIAAIGVLQKSLDYQIREVTRLKQLAKAMTDGAQLSQPEPAKRASMGPLEQTTWAPVGGSAARVFTSRAAARDAEVKK